MHFELAYGKGSLGLDLPAAATVVEPAYVQGLPDQEVLASLDGYTLLRTDENGWIKLISDGEQMWINIEGK